VFSSKEQEELDDLRRDVRRLLQDVESQRSAEEKLLSTLQIRIDSSIELEMELDKLRGQSKAVLAEHERATINLVTLQAMLRAAEATSADVVLAGKNAAEVERLLREESSHVEELEDDQAQQTEQERLEALIAEDSDEEGEGTAAGNGTPEEATEPAQVHTPSALDEGVGDGEATGIDEAVEDGEASVGVEADEKGEPLPPEDLPPPPPQRPEMPLKARQLLGLDDAHKSSKVASLQKQVERTRQRVAALDERGMGDAALLAREWRELRRLQRRGHILLHFLQDQGKTAEDGGAGALAALQQTGAKVQDYLPSLEAIHSLQAMGSTSDVLSNLEQLFSTGPEDVRGLDVLDQQALDEVQATVGALVIREGSSNSLAGLVAQRCIAIEWQSWGFFNRGGRWSGLQSDLPAPLSGLAPFLDDKEETPPSSQHGRQTRARSTGSEDGGVRGLMQSMRRSSVGSSGSGAGGSGFFRKRNEQPVFTNVAATRLVPMDDITPPAAMGWTWVDHWAVDTDETGSGMVLDDEGWHYGDQVSQLLAGHGMQDMGADQGRLGRPLRQLRMRRWRRHCLCTSGGPSTADEQHPVLTFYAKLASAAATLSKKTSKLMEVQNRQTELDGELTARRHSAEDLKSLALTLQEVEARIEEYQAKQNAAGGIGKRFGLFRGGGLRESRQLREQNGEEDRPDTGNGKPPASSKPQDSPAPPHGASQESPDTDAAPPRSSVLSLEGVIMGVGMGAEEPATFFSPNFHP